MDRSSKGMLLYETNGEVLHAKRTDYSTPTKLPRRASGRAREGLAVRLLIVDVFLLLVELSNKLRKRVRQKRQCTYRRRVEPGLGGT
jgi:hypothetical protein